MASRPDEPVTRRIPFERVFNFRDLGGYPTADGHRTRWHVLYRADTLHRLEGEDLERFGALGIKSVLDLRGDRERDTHGRFPLVGPAPVVHEVAMIDEVGDGSEPDPAAARPATTGESYISMAEKGRENIARVMATLAEPGALPGVFHCAAGKDRTGIVAGLLLSVLGVDDDTIVADYLRTGESNEARYDFLAVHDPEYHAMIMSLPDHVRRMDPEAIPSLLGWIRHEFGSPEAYLLGGGLAASAIPHLRATLLEPAA